MVKTLNKASDIIREKLIENKRCAYVTSQQGEKYRIVLLDGNNNIEIWTLKNAKRLNDKKLQIDYYLSVFDIIVDLLVEQGGKAEKGNGRNWKLGCGKCGYDTIVGRIGRDYQGKKDGETVFDPVTFLGAVLNWADICNFGRGYLELTENFKSNFSAY